MPRTTRKMPPVNGVSPGNTATVELPIGLTYHQLLITLGGGATVDQVGEVRVVGDGETFQTYKTATLLDQINQDKGRNAANTVGTDTILVLDFDRFKMITRAAREVTAIGTNLPSADQRPLSTFNLEMELLGPFPAAGSIKVKAVQSSPAPLGFVRKIKHFFFNAPSIGEFEIADIPKGDLIDTIYFDSAEIAEMRLERDNFVVFERTRQENDVIRADNGRGAGPFVGFVYDPLEEGYGSESLITEGARDLRFRLEMSAADPQIGTTIEYVGLLQS